MTRHEKPSGRTFDRSVRLVFAGIAIYSVLALGAALLVDHSRVHEPGGAASSSTDAPPQASAPAPDVGSPEPGSVLIPEVTGIRDAAFADGTWYLTDVRSHMVHVIDTAGTYLRGIGRQGNGPGEFFGPAVVAASGSGLWVANMNVPMIQSFDSDGSFRSLVRLDDPDCAPGSVADAAALDEGVVVLQRCVAGEFGYALKFVGNDGSIGRVEAPIDLSGPFGSQPALASDGRSRVLLGNGATGCLVEFAIEAGAPGSISSPFCVTHLARSPIPEESKEQLEQMVERARGLVELVIPDSLPYFDQVALEPSLAIRAFVESGDVAWRAAVAPSGPILVAVPDAIQVMDGGHALIYREEMLGARISFPKPNR